jgi:bifunctional UDP-N-acetylglucosamine pyrophosphorylase/glucosamine-1-phosphate N-acetyltransferase
VSPRRGATTGAVVLAAGRSKRFGGTQPKVLHPLCGRPIIEHVLLTLREVHRSQRLANVVVVVPPGKQVERAIAGLKLPFPVAFAVQKEPTGTGAASLIGLRKLGDVDDVLILAGDVPLVSPSSLVSLVRGRRDAGACGALLTATLDDGGPYGRIVREGGAITGIVEARDATSDELAIREINTCIVCYTRDSLAQTLPKLRKDNAQGELYLTDVVGRLIATGEHLTSVDGDPRDVLGTNTRAEFALVSRLCRERIVGDLMDAGVTVLDPDTTYVDAGVVVGPDTVLHPNTYLQGTTKVGTGAEIGPSVQIVDSTVGDGTVVTFAKVVGSKIGPRCSVGPFASLRPGTVLKAGAKAGTFVEMKKASIGEGSKVPHLSYMGDVTVGRDANIGAGTITSNYDGKDKHETKIGDEVFTGSDTIFIAPVRVGRGAYTGAGSVVNRDVAPGEVVYGVPAKPQGKKPKSGRKKQAKKKGRRG